MATTTLILCADQRRAKVFRVEGAARKIQCISDLTPRQREKFFPRVVGDLERASGFGAEAKLILCGNPRVLNQICQCMSDSTRNKIIGIVPQNILEQTPEQICTCARLNTADPFGDSADAPSLRDSRKLEGETHNA